MTYTLYNYFDVWGNSVDGFEINNQCKEEHDIYISDYTTDKEICTYLMELGYLNTNDMRRLSVESDGYYIEIQQKNGFPLFGLMPNN